jgi:hypothetical protein
VPIVFKSGRLNLLEPSGPVKACNGIALPSPSFLQLKLVPFCGNTLHMYSGVFQLNLEVGQFASHTSGEFSCFSSFTTINCMIKPRLRQTESFQILTYFPCMTSCHSHANEKPSLKALESFSMSVHFCAFNTDILMLQYTIFSPGGIVHKYCTSDVRVRMHPCVCDLLLSGAGKRAACVWDVARAGPCLFRLPIRYFGTGAFLKFFHTLYLKCE